MNGWVLAIDIRITSVAAAIGGQDRIEVVEFGEGTLPDLATVARTGAPTAEVYATILTAVVREAARDRAAAVPGQLILTYPALWGKREIAVLRAAAASAGLPDPVLITRPVAAASHLAADDHPGQVVAVLDVGPDSVDAVVLRRTRDGFTLTGTPGGLTRPGDYDQETSLRRGIYELLTTITEAGFTPGQLAAVHVVGAASRTHMAADLVTQILGIAPRVAADPEAATVLGALDSVRLPVAGREQSGIVRPMAAGRMLGGIRRKVPRTAAARVMTAIVVIAIAAGAVTGIGTVLHTRQPAHAVITASAHGVIMAYVLTSGVATKTPTVLPVDTATNTAGQPIPVGVSGSDAQLIAVTPDGKTLLVTTADGTSQAGTVTLIHTTDSTAGKPIPVGQQASAIAITPDGETAYVASYASGTVTPITIATGTAGSPITLGTGPGADAIAITPDGKTAYVVNQESGTVTPVTTATNTAGTPITVGEYPSAIAITPDGRTAYVVNSGNGIVPGTVTPISIQANAAGSPIAVGPLPRAIMITPDGRTAYVVTAAAGAPVTPINTATNTAGVPISLGGQAGTLTISPDGKTIYVTHQATSASATTITISRIYLGSHAVGRPITAPIPDANADFLAITPDGKTAYLAGYNASSYSGTLLPVNTATGSSGPPITVTGGRPLAVTITPDAITLTRPLGGSSRHAPVHTGTAPVLGAAEPGTQGCGTVKPDFIYGGGDPSDQVGDIHWQSWGSSMATGTGKALWVTTTVVAAKSEPVRLVAYNLGLRNGKYAYRSLDIYFPQHGQTFRRNVPNFIC